MKGSRIALSVNIFFWFLWIFSLPVAYVSLLVAIFLEPKYFPLYIILLIFFRMILNRAHGKTEPKNGWSSVSKYAAVAVVVGVFRYLPDTSKEAPQIVFTALAFYYFAWRAFKKALAMMKLKLTAAKIIIYFFFLIFSVAGIWLFMRPDYSWLAAFAPIFLLFEVADYALGKRPVAKVRVAAETIFASYAGLCVIIFLTGHATNRFSALYSSVFIGWIIYIVADWLSSKLFPGGRYVISKLQITIASLCLIAMCFVKLYTSPTTEVEKNFKIISTNEGAYDMVMDPQGRYLYAIYGEDTNTIEKYDTLGAEEPIVRKLPGNSQPQRFLYDEKTDRIVLANWGDLGMLMAFFDAKTLRQVKVFERKGMPGGPLNLFLDERERKIYLLGEHSSGIARVNADTMEWEAYGEAGGGVGYGICYSPSSDTLFTTTWLGPFISEVDPEKLVLIRRWRAPYVTYQAECDPDAPRIFVTDPMRRRIVIRDTEGGRLRKIGKFRTGLGVRDFQVSWKKQLLVAGSYIEGMLHVYNIEGGELLGSWETPPYVRGVYYHEETGRIFVACKYGVLELKERFAR